MAPKKTKPPAKNEPLRVVNFRADSETLRAIDALEAAAKGNGLIHSRGVAIRRALIEAAARLENK